MTTLCSRSLSVLAGLSLLLAGCSLDRSSTTARTAIEQALLSTAADRSILGLDAPELSGHSFFVENRDLEGVDVEYVRAALSESLLRSGMNEANSPEDAEILVYPRLAYAAVDDSGFIFGIPEMSMPVIGMGALPIPEMALFKVGRQEGKNRLAVHGVWRADGSLAFRINPAAGYAYHTRWTVFFFFSWRTTDLGPPF